MVTRYADRYPDIQLDVVDIAVRWRHVHDLSLLKRWLGGGLQLLRDLYLFMRRFIHDRPDLVHLTSAGQLGAIRDLVFVTVAGLLRVPVVYHLRFGRIPELSVNKNWEWRLIRRVLSKVQAAIVLDTETERTIKDQMPALEVRCIPNCIDLASLPPVAEDPQQIRKIVFVGWVIPAKGVAELMNAWSSLSGTGWILEIIGPVNPDYRQELMQGIQPDSVVFFGELPHAEALSHLSMADIFVLPSYTEGFPNVVLEAMALGRATVATSVGALPAMLADGCGCLVEPRDADSLKEALRYLMAHEGERATMGARARSKAVAVYSLSAVFAAYRGLWEWAVAAEISRQ